MEDDRILKIRELEERIREAEASEENQRRLALWRYDCDSRECCMHPLPVDRNRPYISFELERIGYAQILGFSLKQYYTDPIECLYRSLQMSLFKFETFRNDTTPIGRSVSYWPGVGFEASLIGLPQIFTDEDAWTGRANIIDRSTKIEDIAYPDFFTSPVMRETHAFYARMCEAASDDFSIRFPQWYRSAWGVAWAVRGIDNLVMDCIDEPGWVAALLDRFTDFRIRFEQDRAKFLGAATDKPTHFYNDEVAAPMVSPKIYRKLILPSEIKTAESCGGINYWHSCGNTTPFMQDINKIPDVSMVHVSPWSDIQKAAECYSEDKTLEIALNPLTEVMAPETPGAPRRRLEEIREVMQGRSCVVRADGFEIIHNVKEDIRILQDWMDMAHEVLE